jgi:hypothetical protein
VARVAYAVALTLVTMSVIAAGTTAVGAWAPGPLLSLIGAGAIVAQLWPRQRVAVTVSVGMLALALVNPIFSVYFFALVAALAVNRGRTIPFAVVLVLGALILPKMTHFNRAHFWLGAPWLNEPSLTLAIYASAYWWRARVDRRRAGDGTDPGNGQLGQFLLLYLLPAHAQNPMVFSPKVMAKVGAPDARALATLLGWYALKTAGLVALARLDPHTFLGALGPGDVAATGRGALWGMVGATYLRWYLMLAASADIPILIMRLYGWPLANPFRAALFAWNPIEMWRRWSIYNRQFLLTLVYFPLGGNRRHRYRNIVLTFLASALVLHTGWFGSRYWAVGPSGWRDETIYFMLQAVAVCSCLWLWERLGKDPRSDRALRLSPLRVLATVATQGWSALAHVFVLAQGIELGERLDLVGRCFGL